MLAKAAALSVMSLVPNDAPTTEIYTLSLHDALPILIVSVSLSIALLYSGTSSSSTVNVTSSPPFQYLSTVNSFVQVSPPPSGAVSVSVYVFPSEPVSVKVTSSGRSPSWSCADRKSVV
jgi:hypothetical protein